MFSVSHRTISHKPTLVQSATELLFCAGGNFMFNSIEIFCYISSDIEAETEEE